MNRELGGLPVFPLGFGTWGLGGVADGAPPAYGPTSDKVSLAALDCATRLGVNFFDTSGLYGRGHSERLLRRALPPESLVASKAGYLDAHGHQDFSPPFLLSELRASLDRLGRDRLDLFQLHDPPLELMNDQLWKHLESWRQQGLCRTIGISLRTPHHALQIMERWPVDCLQLNFNLFDQRARELGILDECARRGVSVIARTPLSFGFLSGEVGENFARGDHRAGWSSEQRKLWNDSRKRFRNALGAAYAGHDVHLALAFCLAYPQISVVIPGMLTPDQVRENLECLAHPLSEPQRVALEEVYNQNQFFVSEPTAKA